MQPLCKTERALVQFPPNHPAARQTGQLEAATSGATTCSYPFGTDQVLMRLCSQVYCIAMSSACLPDPRPCVSLAGMPPDTGAAASLAGKAELGGDYSADGAHLEHCNRMHWTEIWTRCCRRKSLPCE